MQTWPRTSLNQSGSGLFTWKVHIHGGFGSMSFLKVNWVIEIHIWIYDITNHNKAIDRQIRHRMDPDVLWGLLHANKISDKKCFQDSLFTEKYKSQFKQKLKMFECYNTYRLSELCCISDNDKRCPKNLMHISG